MEVPCEWKFATKFASDCKCDALLHSGDSGKSLSRPPALGLKKKVCPRVSESPKRHVTRSNDAVMQHVAATLHVAGMPRFHVLEVQNVILAAVWHRVSGSVLRHTTFRYAEKRNSGEIFAHMGENCGEKLCRFSSFNFHENWPQEISQKVGGKFPEP